MVWYNSVAFTGDHAGGCNAINFNPPWQRSFRQEATNFFAVESYLETRFATKSTDFETEFYR